MVLMNIRQQRQMFYTLIVMLLTIGVAPVVFAADKAVTAKPIAKKRAEEPSSPGKKRHVKKAGPKKSPPEPTKALSDQGNSADDGENAGAKRGAGSKVQSLFVAQDYASVIERFEASKRSAEKLPVKMAAIVAISYFKTGNTKKAYGIAEHILAQKLATKHEKIMSELTSAKGDPTAAGAKLSKTSLDLYMVWGYGLAQTYDEDYDNLDSSKRLDIKKQVNGIYSLLTSTDKDVDFEKIEEMKSFISKREELEVKRKWQRTLVFRTGLMLWDDYFEYETSAPYELYRVYGTMRAYPISFGLAYSNYRYEVGANFAYLLGAKGTYGVQNGNKTFPNQNVMAVMGTLPLLFKPMDYASAIGIEPFFVYRSMKLKDDTIEVPKKSQIYTGATFVMQFDIARYFRLNLKAGGLINVRSGVFMMEVDVPVNMN